MSEPTNSDDVIDSRDVIARIEELECERECIADIVAEREEQLAANDDESQTREELADALSEAQRELIEWDADNGEELAALKAFAAQAEGYAPDWNHGATLIRDSYFEEYARQYADDVGAINAEASWPNTCIDWEKAANELQQDYSAVEFDGVTYWAR